MDGFQYIICEGCSADFLKRRTEDEIFQYIICEGCSKINRAFITSYHAVGWRCSRVLRLFFQAAACLRENNSLVHLALFSYGSTRNIIQQRLEKIK